MKILTPSRVVAASRRCRAALSFGVAHANTDHNGALPRTSGARRACTAPHNSSATSRTSSA
jgi:hypothetical protein